MHSWLKFIYNTFIIQEKNRRDVLDYMRAVLLIISTITMIWMIAFYGLKLR